MTTLRRSAVCVALVFVGGGCFGHRGQMDGDVRPPRNAPTILVATFWSSDGQLGIQAADEARNQMRRQHSAKELFVYPKGVVDSALTSLGYRPDSALARSDLVEVARRLGADYVLEGAFEDAGPGTPARLEAQVVLRHETRT